MADDEQAVVIACINLVFRSLDLRHFQEQFLEKVRWTCPPMQVHAARTPLDTSRACMTSVSCRAVRQARHSARHDFSCAIAFVPCLDVTQQVEFGL